MRHVCLIGVLCSAVWTAGAEIVRGIHLSTHRAGREWGSDLIGPTFDDLVALGANWVAIHPYARIERDGSVRHRPIDPDAPPQELLRPIREAHARGLKILIKPHLGYWRSGFAWRGEIEFPETEARSRFWDGYRRWIVELAAACREADGFVVGTELDLMLGQEKEWRELITDVRAVSSAPLSYAVNWDRYREVPFWDALDVIGIQAYFPVAERADASEQEIRAGWATHMEELRGYAEALDKWIVFTELGYNQSFDAPLRPWDDRSDGPEAEAVQLRCLRVALEAMDAEPRVLGAFLWKWFPQPHSAGRNFRLATPAVTELLRERWLPRSGAADSP